MNMKSLNLASLSIADLSRLHEEVRGVLTQKIEAEKRKEKRGERSVPGPPKLSNPKRHLFAEGFLRTLVSFSGGAQRPTATTIGRSSWLAFPSADDRQTETTKAK